MERLTIIDLPMEGLKCIERQHLKDSRGFFARLFCAEELAAAGWSKPIVQVNHSYTARAGIVRGLHFQYPPDADMKLVICVKGAVWDVAVDLRAGSPTILRWHAEELSAENRRAMLIPEGFAHGFQTLTPEVNLLYCHTAPYVPTAEGGLNPMDPRLGIAWPLPVTVLSARDRAHAMLEDDFQGVR